MRGKVKLSPELVSKPSKLQKRKNQKCNQQNKKRHVVKQVTTIYHRMLQLKHKHLLWNC